MGWVSKGIHIFLMGISSKVNVIARLEFEHTYYVVTVQLFSHYITGIPLSHVRDANKNNCDSIKYQKLCVVLHFLFVFNSF